MENSLFAEIDIEPVPRHSEVAPVSTPISNLAPEQIAPRAPDPIREKFFEMRTLASKRPFPKSDSEFFFRQALFMEDFTDNFDGNAPLNMYYPSYQRMGYDCLRTYFTWRTRLRSGDILQVSTSYIFLYIYELLSGIGVDSPAHGLKCLMDVWNAFAKSHAAIEKNMPKWLKDYHICYETEHSFAQFVFDNNLQSHYPLTLLFDTETAGLLAQFNKLSSYDITKSKFFRDGNEEIMARCFDAAIGGIRAFCAEKHTRFEELLIYSVSRRVPWQPFENALFCSKAPPSERRVFISEYERYFCTKGEWSANLPIYYSSQKDFIGYIIKKTEACLRTTVGYKYKLAVEMKPGSPSFRELQKPAAKRSELDGVIEKAVRDFHSDMTRIVVTVDHENLSRVREEASKTQEKLIVEDGILPLPVADEEMAAFSEREASANSAQRKPAVKREDNAAISDQLPQTLSFADGWDALRDALTETEREVMRIVLADDGGSNIAGVKTFANEQGVMLEVLIDGINEKASDCIGDSIMELADEVYIFDEYKSYISGIIR